MALIIPKNNAKEETLDATLKIYYDANDWVENAYLIENLSKALDELGIEESVKERQSYTKKTQVLAYYGFIAWEDETNAQSRRRITDLGKSFYEARKTHNTTKCIEIIIESLNSCTFGRNVTGCSSDSDLEPPNIFLKSALLLGGINLFEFAYILQRMEFDKVELADAVFDVLLKRKREETASPNVDAAKWTDPKPILALGNWGLFNVEKKNGTNHYYLNQFLIDNYYKDLMALRTKNTEKLRFNMNDSEYNENAYNKSRQIIFYGAPGTGKSHKVNIDTKGEAVVRTTFHPDSDYSTFVGAYKPKMGKGKVYGAQGPLQKDGQDIEEPKIIYEFVFQAFLKAYLAAWKKYSIDSENPKLQYLVIEEINRGNCAQIFGDIFQLLDRSTNGFSTYPIEADSDLQDIISRKFNEEEGLYMLDKKFNVDDILDNYKSNHGESRTLTDDIRDGHVLLLPKNLYIWATMNTSDQSLFPIDAAFKRRWDWQYMPITYKDNGWYISVDEYEYEWVTFLRKINKLIGETTHSEDKKLGDYFYRPKDKEIDSERFVSKVIFYLWNDVFKDYEFANSVFDDIDGRKLTFDKFYTTINSETAVVEDKVVLFLNKLDEAIDKEHSMLRQKGSLEGGIKGNDFTNYSFNDSKPLGKSALGLAVMMEFLNSKPMSFDEIKVTFPDTMLGNVGHKGLIVKDDVDLGSYSRYYAQGFISSDGVNYKIYKQWTVSNIQNIIDFAFSQGWKVEVKGSWKRKDNNA